MPFSYADFLSFVKKEGLAQQNRFYIDIALPPSMGKYGYRNLSLLCKNVALPFVSLSTSPVRITGEQYEVPYDRNFSPASMMFFVDRKMQVKMFFDVWINQIQRTDTRTIGYFDDIVAPTINIHVLDKSELQTLYTVTLYNAYPKTLGAMNLDHDSSGLQLFDVSFEYQYYDTEGALGDYPKVKVSTTTPDTGIAKGISSLSGSKPNFIGSLLTGGFSAPTIFGTSNVLQLTLDKAVSFGNQSILPTVLACTNDGAQSIQTSMGQIIAVTNDAVSAAVPQSFTSSLLNGLGSMGTSALDGAIGSMQSMANNVLNQSLNAVLVGGPIPDVEVIAQSAAQNVLGASQTILNQSASAVLTATNQATTAVTTQNFPPQDNSILHGAVAQAQSLINSAIGTQVNRLGGTVTSTVNQSIASLFT